MNNWAKKAYVKFGNLSQNELFKEEKDEKTDDIVSIFTNMSQVVVEDLSKIKDSRANEEDKEIDYGDVFPDLQKKDFVDKNVRIRPTSGITHADETKDGRQSNVSKGAGEDDGWEALSPGQFDLG